jgi:NTP pyrophosphatase (non-canonical NTP hydrolase)
MSEIKHNEMVRALAKDGWLIKNEMSGQDCHLLHMALGFVGEVAELQEPFEDYCDLKPLDVENVVEELGDMEFYLEGLRQGIGIEYQQKCEDICDESTVSYHIDVDLKHLVILAGKLLDAVKRVVIYRKPVDVPLISTHLQNIYKHMTVIRYRVKVTRQDTLDANIAKLGKRYEGLQYSNQAAVERADKTV